VGFRVELVDATITYPLRREVLRPGLSLEEIAAEDPVGLTFAALDLDSGEVLASASLLEEEVPEGVPPQIGALPARRLRFMASSPGKRRSGLGSAVLEAIFDHLAARGGALLWCTARESAQAFYEHAGFVGAGEPFVIEGVGPHLVMWRLVEAAAAPDPARL
jgi:GNAT superfamily N-acetyltransferase